MNCGHHVPAPFCYPWWSIKCCQVKFQEHDRGNQAPMNNIFFLVLLVILGLINPREVYGAGECGISSPDKRLGSWLLAFQQQWMQMLQLLIAKFFGVKPEIAFTIPQRCNISDRPVGLWVTSVEITQCLEGGNNGCEGTCQNMWCGSLEECEL
ncbi:hypothetical protein K1719_039745 [Acacia pycnantha]|nr:hypothetical protein K1719_039745 [Acacia pycnantha]